MKPVPKLENNQIKRQGLNYFTGKKE